MSDNLGGITGNVGVGLPSPEFMTGPSSGLLWSSSNLTCFWNEKAWSGLSYCVAPLRVFTVPGTMLKTSRRNSVWLLEEATEGRVAWPARETSSAWTCSCSLWIDCWCSRSRCCCVVCADSSCSRYCTTAWLMACWISVSRWSLKVVNLDTNSCWWAADSTSLALRASWSLLNQLGLPPRTLFEAPLAALAKLHMRPGS